ncbi:MAG: diaminopimelate decarboxylase [Candidatus Metalachnospira sp.]|nr:diaminopimelate decarboxylase [Candidatus Metalachnospira sp.]
MICNNLGINNKGHLTFAGQDTTELAEKYGTPLYLIDEEKIREKMTTYVKAMKENFGESSMPLYASKALCFKKIYNIAAEENMGVDVVSPGELYTALKAGFPMENVYFHGNNKTDADIDFAIENKIGYFICDNLDELDAINVTAKKYGVIQKILLRLTPGIDPHTHVKISTGKIDSKFGIAIETGQAEEAIKISLGKQNVELCGYHCHIGSQTFDIKPFVDGAEIMLKFIAHIKNTLGYEAQVLNLGGGMGVRYIEEHPEIDYSKNIKGIADMMKEKCSELGINLPTVLMEPGRSIVADAGMTLYTVGGTKEIPGYKNYVSIDGGMTDNPRYTLYESPYTIMLANRASVTPEKEYTVGGRCCESGDLIQENVMLPTAKKGDILAVMTTGAYNYSMASNYNRIPRPPIVMLNKGDCYITVKRESFADLMINDL